MTLTITLSAEAEQRLQEQAARHGQTLEGFARQLLERETLSLTEFDRRLDELSEGLSPLPSLPSELSRADLYADHD